MPRCVFGTGDLVVEYEHCPGEPGSYWDPGEPSRVEITDVRFRGRELSNISDQNYERLEEELLACHTADGPGPWPHREG